MQYKRSSCDEKYIGVIFLKLLWQSRIQDFPQKTSACEVRKSTLFFPPTEWREGNVFSCVCLSVCLSTVKGSHMFITYDVLDLTVKPPPHPSPLQTWDMDPHLPASDIWWPSLETCSKLFTWGPNPQYWHLVATKACTAGKCGEGGGVGGWFRRRIHSIHAGDSRYI